MNSWETYKVGWGAIILVAAMLLVGLMMSTVVVGIVIILPASLLGLDQVGNYTWDLIVAFWLLTGPFSVGLVAKDGAFTPKRLAE